MTDLRIGLVGAGMVAEYHIEGWRCCSGARIVGIADPNSTHASARAAEAGVEAFGSLSDMLRTCRLDVVDIVTPPATHTVLIKQALAAGLHVLCQKPLAPTLEEALAIVSGLPPAPRVMVHENWRWRAPYRALKANLQSGDIGKPDGFTFRVESSGLIARPNGTFPALERQAFFATLDRFLVIEVLVHHLDVLSFLLGPVEVRHARLRRRCQAIRAEDYAHIELTAGGVPGVLTGDFCKPEAPERPCDILTFEGVEHAAVHEWALTKNGQRLTTADPVEGYADSYVQTIAHFARCLRSGEPFETPPTQALQVLTAVERIYAIAERE